MNTWEAEHGGVRVRADQGWIERLQAEVVAAVDAADDTGVDPVFGGVYCGCGTCVLRVAAGVILPAAVRAVADGLVEEAPS